MITLVYGNEPYLIQQYKKKIVREVKEPNLNLKEVESWDKDLMTFVSSYSFTDDPKILIIKNDTLDHAISEEFLKQIKYLSNFNIYIMVDSVDKRKENYKKIKTNGTIIVKDKNIKDLETVVVSFLRKNNCYIKREVYDVLCDRINYFKEDMNLYFVVDYLKKLIMVNGEIKIEDIKKIIAKNEEEKIFEVIQYLCEGNSEETFKQTKLILMNNENHAFMFLAILLRIFRIRYKLYKGFTMKELNIHKMTYIPDISYECTYYCMQIILDTVRLIKKYTLNPIIGVNVCMADLFVHINTYDNKTKEKVNE